MSTAFILPETLASHGSERGVEMLILPGRERPEGPRLSGTAGCDIPCTQWCEAIIANWLCARGRDRTEKSLRMTAERHFITFDVIESPRFHPLNCLHLDKPVT
jgi:hypothetical protein